MTQKTSMSSASFRKQAYTICVINASLQATEEDFVKYFNEHIQAPIEPYNVRILRVGGYSKGWLYVSFHSEEDMQIALGLHGQSFMDRVMRISSV